MAVHALVCFCVLGPMADATSISVPSKGQAVSTTMADSTGQHKATRKLRRKSALLYNKTIMLCNECSKTCLTNVFKHHQRRASPKMGSHSSTNLHSSNT